MGVSEKFSTFLVQWFCQEESYERPLDHVLTLNVQRRWVREFENHPQVWAVGRGPDALDVGPRRDPGMV